MHTVAHYFDYVVVWVDMFMFIVFMCTVAPYSDQAEVWVDVCLHLLCLCLQVIQIFTCLLLTHVYVYKCLHVYVYRMCTHPLCTHWHLYSDQAAVSVDIFMFIVYMFMFTVYMFVFHVYMFMFTDVYVYCVHVLHAHSSALL